jgi:5-methylcytosine-specific restriction endonuclease McrA
MLTQTMIDNFAALAGEDYAWDNGVAGWKPAHAVKVALRTWLADFQGGLCVFCEAHLDENLELCHIVSRGPAIKGFIPGVVVAGCAPCNAAQKVRGPIVHILDIARPDLVALDWPSVPTLKNM